MPDTTIHRQNTITKLYIPDKRWLPPLQVAGVLPINRQKIMYMGRISITFIKSIITGKEGRNYENYQGYSQNKEET